MIIETDSQHLLSVLTKHIVENQGLERLPRLQEVLFERGIKTKIVWIATGPILELI